MPTIKVLIRLEILDHIPLNKPTIPLILVCFTEFKVLRLAWAEFAYTHVQYI